MNFKVKIWTIKKESKTLALADIIIEEKLVIKSFKVVSGAKGLFVGMPNMKVGEEYKDMVFPITKEFREELIKAILEAYEEEAIPF